MKNNFIDVLNEYRELIITVIRESILNNEK
jgi:hypothetical protein